MDNTIINKVTTGNVTTATINDVEYKNITRKFITSKDIYDDNIPLEDKKNLENGINVIDIDWNGAQLGEQEIHHTSDLIKIINSGVNRKPQDYWG